jgi:two-component system, NtrC family, response regulator AlgB
LKELAGRILVIDDEPDIVLTVSMFLESKGFEVKSASGGQEGIDMFHRALTSDTPFDLVITDYRLPIKHGDEVVNEILALAPNQAIILMTAYNIESPSLQALSKEKVQTVQKPFEPDDFVELVQAACDQKGILTFGLKA